MRSRSHAAVLQMPHVEALFPLDRIEGSRCHAGFPPRLAMRRLIAQLRLKEISEALNSTCSPGRDGQSGVTASAGGDKRRNLLNRSANRIMPASGFSRNRVCVRVYRRPDQPPIPTQH
jgi:hypothetical protein